MIDDWSVSAPGGDDGCGENQDDVLLLSAFGCRATRGGHAPAAAAGPRVDLSYGLSWAAKWYTTSSKLSRAKVKRKISG